VLIKSIDILGKYNQIISYRGAFHLTEIPEILLENQMEHANFWNAVSKIPDNLSRLHTNWKLLLIIIIIIIKGYY
jgi:hypothetical protein